MASEHQFVDIHMLSNFVHQIINPLNGVLGTLDNVIDGTTPEDRKQQKLKSVRAQLEHTVELIRNLAYLSQLSVTSGLSQVVEERLPCALPEVIIEAIQFYQESGFTNNIQISLSDRETQYVVHAHKALLRQVFMNIIENGIKYGDANTSIAITPKVPKGNTGELLVEIVGTGVGFSHSEREKIFELGYRGKDAKERVVPGSGIGLFISRRILREVHDADIEAEHVAATRQTTFRIRFSSHTVRSYYHDGR
jgi:signal transduction histidine kinase